MVWTLLGLQAMMIPKVIAEDSLLDLRTGIILSEVTEFKPNSRMVILMHAIMVIFGKKITLPDVISCRTGKNA